MKTIKRFNNRFDACRYLREHELKHYVYMLMDGSVPIYVGISKNWKRIHAHFSENKQRVNILLRRKIRTMVKEGRSVEVVIVGHFHSLIETDHAERSLILLYGKKIDRTGQLCNLSDGGVGSRLPSSNTQKAAASKANKGKLKTPETIKKLSESIRASYASGRTPSFKGKRHTEETKKKLSELHSGENNPFFGVTGEDHFNYGKRRTEEQKQRISAGQDPEKMQWGDLRKEQLKEYWASQPILTCIHCGKQSSFKAAMIRYHFDSCKSKLILQN